MMRNLLEIDPQRTRSRIQAFIRDHMAAVQATGVLIGLSGGIDSAALAALAAGTVGASALHLAYLYDRHSVPALRRCAQDVAARLGTRLTESSITDAMRSQGVYHTSGMRVTGFAGGINRTLHRLYRLLSGETAFLSTLIMGAPGDARAGGADSRLRSLVAQPEAGVNDRHRYRRQLLETLALEHGWLLLGAANRSEWMVGWFVQGGVDDLPIQPLLGLYKTQVRQLAADLDLPACVTQHPPSPDMLPGITDEFALGISYARLDLILDHLQGGLTWQQLDSSGVRQPQRAYVEELVRWSGWKRGGSAVPASIDGGPDGDLRKPGAT